MYGIPTKKLQNRNLFTLDEDMKILRSWKVIKMRTLV